MGRLRFRFSPEKFVNAVAYIAGAIPHATKLTVCKAIYFADKEHLIRFGRPITGDVYYRLAHGQIPSRGLDMLRKRSDPSSNALVEKYVDIVGNTVRPKQPADKKVFSKSDLEILESVAKKLSPLSTSQIRRLAHEEPSFKESKPGCPIDFDLFFKDRPESAPVKILAEREQEARDVLRLYAAE